MKSRFYVKSLLAVTTTLISVLSFNSQAKAADFGNATLSIGFECNNDVTTLILGQQPLGTWQYSHDAVGDGTGGNHYDLYGMGFMEDAKYTYFAINTYNMGIDAGIDTVNDKGKTVYNIGWGDLLINTTGKNVAEANGNLFGVHFGGNTSGVSQVGLYGNVVGASVAGLHTSGVHENLSAYANNFAQSKPIPTLAEYQQWSLETYVSYQPDSTQQAFINVNFSLDDYVQTQSASVQKAFKDVNLSFENYLQQQNNSTKQAFVDVNLSFEDYLNRQSPTTKTKYHDGHSSTVQSVNNNYQKLLTNAQTKVNQTQNNYATLIEKAQTTVNSTTTKYEEFIVKAQETVSKTQENYTKDLSAANVNNSYSSLVSKYTKINTLNDKMFGSLSREEGLAYFDQKGANVIGSGNWLGQIEMLNLDQLTAAGYNKSLFQGGQTIAFRIERSAFDPESVPEPATLLGLATVGLALVNRKRFCKSVN
ncbi:PEP-CTERM sorting domain-containing protein [Aerosakkonemataceae cyanobacterium BLCC-F154]|uniref:PEP-CTERM sorting domain-containing protein n=1 Tax=Floridaenema fluviatile BLCC-F154 TaxID=3153640 RepID=A0ABV4YBW8_9CYAN